MGFVEYLLLHKSDADLTQPWRPLLRFSSVVAAPGLATTGFDFLLCTLSPYDLLFQPLIHVCDSKEIKVGKGACLPLL